MRIISYGLVAALLFGGIFLFFALRSSTFMVIPGQSASSSLSGETDTATVALSLDLTLSQGQIIIQSANKGDFGPQEPLLNPPRIAKAIYLTGWSAGTPSRVKNAIAFIKRTELNAVVIDIKDYSGNVSYHMDAPLVGEIGADGEIRITHPNALLKELHDNGIYVIGRITVFQDPILAKAKPEWALHDTIDGTAWRDRKGISWMDPAAQEVWEYNAAIAKDAFARGFDEVNFDYVRFASDGDISRISYPFWDGKTPRHTIIRNFFAYLRSELSGRIISADLFGLVTVNKDDLGIGQVIEDAYEYFDYVAPMVYPSHYAKGFIGFENPGAHPYEVMKYSLDRAREKHNVLAMRLAASSGEGTSTEAIAAVSRRLGKLRPWIQDFDLGATYTAEMVRQEFQAVYDALGTTSDAYAGWYVWDPANTYTEAALEHASSN